jgi:hypothetical protein
MYLHVMTARAARNTQLTIDGFVAFSFHSVNKHDRTSTLKTAALSFLTLFACYMSRYLLVMNRPEDEDLFLGSHGV